MGTIERFRWGLVALGLMIASAALAVLLAGGVAAAPPGSTVPIEPTTTHASSACPGVTFTLDPDHAKAGEYVTSEMTGLTPGQGYDIYIHGKWIHWFLASSTTMTDDHESVPESLAPGTGTATLYAADSPKTADTLCVSIPFTVDPPPVAATVGAQDAVTGIWYLKNSVGAVTQFYYGNPGDVPFVGDWDCDGIDTPGLFRQSDAYAYLRNSNTQGVADIRFFFGNPSDVPLAGDWDGDGCDTVSIYRPSEQRFYIMNELGENEGGLGVAEYFFIFGNPGDQPVVGDWDGDGVDEIGLYRETSGFFYYRNTLDTGVADGQFYFGNPADRFVSGDWGIVDEADTPAVFRPGEQMWYFRHTLTPGNADSQFGWGEATWQPVAGHFGLG